MGEFPAAVLLLGVFSVVILYFAARFFKDTIFIVMSFLATVLGAAGYSITAGTTNQGLFEIIFILSLIAMPISVLHFMLANTKTWLENLAKGRL